MLAQIIRESDDNYEGAQPIPHELFLEKEPTADVWLVANFDTASNLRTGIWVGQPGKIRVPAYPTDETFTVLEGLIELVPTEGPAIRIGPGDSCVIRRGWSGVWHTVETTRKCYVTFNG